MNEEEDTILVTKLNLLLIQTIILHEMNVAPLLYLYNFDHHTQDNIQINKVLTKYKLHELNFFEQTLFQEVQVKKIQHVCTPEEPLYLKFNIIFV